MSAAWGRQGVKKAPSSCVRSIWDEPSKTKAFPYTAHRVWNTPRYHFVCCTGQPLPAYIHTQPRNVGKTAMHYWKAGSAPLFTQAARRGERFAPDCCPCIRWAALWERVLQESYPVHRICRMIVRILVRDSQIVNILGTSSEDTLIQESVLQEFLDDFCSCVKRRKLYTSTNEKSSRQGLDFHTLMC